MIGHDQERIGLRSCAGDPLVMSDPLLHPYGDRGTLGVVGKVLLQTLGVELELAGRSGDGIGHRVFVEVVPAGRMLLPVLLVWNDEVVLLLELFPADHLVEAHPVEDGFDQLGLAEAVGDLVEHADLLGHFAHRFVVALGFADRLDRLPHEEHALEAVSIPQARHDVVHLESGIGRQDDIGVETVVLQPRMLSHDAFDLRAPHSFDDVVAAVPARDPTGSVAPHHVELGPAILLGDGIGVLLVLVVGGLLVAPGAPEVHGRPMDGLLDEGLGDELLAPGLRRAPVRLEDAVPGRRRRQVAEHVHVLPAGANDIPRHPQVGYLRLVDARFAEALHAQEDHLEPSRLVRVGAPGHAAAEVMADGDDLLGPIAGEGLDGPYGHTAFCRGPLRGLRNAVRFADHVVLICRSPGVGLDVLLVVRALGDPHVQWPTAGPRQCSG